MESFIEGMLGGPEQASLIGHVSSMALGAILIIVGIVIKKIKREQSWWIILVILGAISLILNTIQLIL